MAGLRRSARRGTTRFGPYSTGVRIRTLGRAKAAQSVLRESGGKRGAEESRERLDTPLTEASHARHPELSDESHEHRPRVGGEGFDGGWSGNRGAAGCVGARLISSLSSLPGLK